MVKLIESGNIGLRLVIL